MKKTLLIALLALTLTIFACGCGQDSPGTDGGQAEPDGYDEGASPDGQGGIVPYDLIGEWDCLDSAPDSESGYGYLHLRIEEDGSFSLYDQEAGNPGIAGTMNLVNAPEDLQNITEGTLDIICGDEDFDPPFCWDIDYEDSLDFAVPESMQLKLGHGGKWLTFEQEID